MGRMYWTEIKLWHSKICMQGLESFNSFLIGNSSEDKEFTGLVKLLTLIQTGFFQFLWRFSTYLWDINSLENNCRGRKFGYLYRLGKTFFLGQGFVFSRLKVLLCNISKSNSLLSKSTLRYLLCYKVFRVEVKGLQGKFKSMWVFVFH